jgi:hypothetical protein
MFCSGYNRPPLQSVSFPSTQISRAFATQSSISPSSPQSSDPWRWANLSLAPTRCSCMGIIRSTAVFLTVGCDRKFGCKSFLVASIPRVFLFKFQTQMLIKSADFASSIQCHCTIFFAVSDCTCMVKLLYNAFAALCTCASAWADCKLQHEKLLVTSRQTAMHSWSDTLYLVTHSQKSDAAKQNSCPQEEPWKWSSLKPVVPVCQVF